jgi:hypothetical protein
MTLAKFVASLKKDKPPASVSKLLEALWWDGKGEWDRAHDIAQDVLGSNGAWVHAYLHRKEGDNSNAAYWYSKAGKIMPAGALQEEWQYIVTALL